MPKFKEGHDHACLRCGYVWKSALRQPKACPKCKSYRWNKMLDRRSNSIESKLKSR